MKGKIKRVLAILLAVLFVTTMAASAVSASSVKVTAPSAATSTLKASVAFGDGGDCGNDYWWRVLHHLPIPPRPGPWYSIDQVTQLNSVNQM